MALTAAYFVGDISVPNIAGSSIIETANLFDLQIAISKHEPIYLEKVMGATLYQAYAAGIATPSPEARWTALRDQIYQIDPVLSIGISATAYYVYFFFMRSQKSLTVVNAEVEGAHENLPTVTRWDKMVDAWNECARLTEKITDWLDAHAADYPELKRYEQTRLTYITHFGI